MDDAIFTEVSRNCTEYKISSFRLDFDFTMLSFDRLNDVNGVAVIDNISLGHSFRTNFIHNFPIFKTYFILFYSDGTFIYFSVYF